MYKKEKWEKRKSQKIDRLESKKRREEKVRNKVEERQNTSCYSSELVTILEHIGNTIPKKY